MKKILATTVILFLAACNLQPVYLASNNKSENLAQIIVKVVKSESQPVYRQQLHNELRKKFGHLSYDYDKILTVRYTEEQISYGLKTDATYAAKRVTAKVDFTLTEKTTGVILDEFTLSRSSIFSTTSFSPFAQEGAKDLVVRAVISEIAEIAHNRILAKFG